MSTVYFFSRHDADKKMLEDLKQLGFENFQQIKESIISVNDDGTNVVVTLDGKEITELKLDSGCAVIVPQMELQSEFCKRGIKALNAITVATINGFSYMGLEEIQISISRKMLKGADPRPNNEHKVQARSIEKEHSFDKDTSFMVVTNAPEALWLGLVFSKLASAIAWKEHCYSHPDNIWDEDDTWDGYPITYAAPELIGFPISTYHVRAVKKSPESPEDWITVKDKLVV